MAKAEVRARVGEAISLVQLEGREQSRPRQLSGGQQQRVALATGAREPARGAAAGRAAGRARPQAAHRHAEPAQGSPAHRRRDVLLRHPRPGRGVLDVRPGGGHEPRRCSSRWARPRTSTTGPRRRSWPTSSARPTGSAGRIESGADGPLHGRDRRHRHPQRARPATGSRPAPRWSSWCDPRTCSSASRRRRRRGPGRERGRCGVPRRRAHRAAALTRARRADRGRARRRPGARARGAGLSSRGRTSDAWLIPAAETAP